MLHPPHQQQKRARPTPTHETLKHLEIALGNLNRTRVPSKGLLIGSIAAAVAAAIAFILRMAVSLEMKGIEQAQAWIVQVGAQRMSKSDYLAYASGLVSTYNTATLVLLLLAAAMAIVWYRKNH